MRLGQSEIQILKNNKITMVGRYLTGKFKMTPEEIKNIVDENISVIPIFEYGNKIEYFTFEQGIKDAQKAVLAAQKLGIPMDNSVTIYFAVDNDFTLGDLEGNITEYFKGVFSKIAGAHIGYNIGVYGARYICTYLLEKGYVTNSYVASSSYEFELNMGYKMPGRWGFNQYSTMNINEQGIAHGIYLNGVVPIDKVVASGYDRGVVRLEQNGIITSMSPQSIVTPKSNINDKYLKEIEEFSNFLTEKVLNIKITTKDGNILNNGVGSNHIPIKAYEAGSTFSDMVKAIIPTGTGFKGYVQFYPCWRVEPGHTLDGYYECTAEIGVTINEELIRTYYNFLVDNKENTENLLEKLSSLVGEYMYIDIIIGIKKDIFDAAGMLMSAGVYEFSLLIAKIIESLKFKDIVLNTTDLVIDILSNARAALIGALADGLTTLVAFIATASPLELLAFLVFC